MIKIVIEVDVQDDALAQALRSLAWEIDNEKHTVTSVIRDKYGRKIGTLYVDE